MSARLAHAVALTLLLTPLIGGWSARTTSAASPPPNDAFANATVLEGANGSVTGSNVGATVEPGETPCVGGNSTVWYRWTAPGPGKVKFSTAGSDFDSFVAAYTGSSVGSLTIVDCGNYVYPDDHGFVVWDVTQGATYHIAVGGEGGQEGTVKLAWELPNPKPANDDFANATAMEGVQGEYQGTTAWATKQSGEPNHAGVAGGSSIWYRWTAPQSGTGRILVNGGGKTVLAVYRGSSVASLTEVARDAGTAPDGWNRVSFSIVAGAAYSIAVDRRTSESAAFTIHWRLPPPNDDFANAQAISGSSATLTGVTDAATAEPGEPIHGGFWPASASIWYRWTAPSSGPTVIDTQGSEFGWNSTLGVYTGSSLGTLHRVASSDDFYDFTSSTTYSRVIFQAVAGTTYRIAVDRVEGYSGDVQLRLNPPPLSGDDFGDDAQFSSWHSGSISWDNGGATREPGESNHAGDPGGSSVWFHWRTTHDGILTLSTEGSSLDTLLAVYSGDSLGSLTPIAWSNDWDGNRWSYVRIEVRRGQLLRIAVDGVGGVEGAFRLRWWNRAQVENDDFADRRVLEPTSSGSAPVANFGATREAGEPDHAGNAAGMSVWYSWTAPKTAYVEMTTEYGSSPFDSVLAVYTGSTLSGLTHIASNDDQQYSTTSRVLFLARQGVVYQIAVDGADRAANIFGTTDLRWQMDETAPVVSSVSLEDGAMVPGTTVLRAQASDDFAVGRVDFLAGSTLIASDRTAPYEASWTPSADGATTVTFRAFDTSANKTEVARSVTVDRTAPTVSAPRSGFARGSQASSSGLVLRTAWSATDPSGVARYSVHRQVNGGLYSAVTLASATATATAATIPLGQDGRYRVRAQDRVGHWSGWKYGLAYEVVAKAESSAARTGTWRSATTGAYQGALVYSSTSGSTARFSFTGRQVALISSTGPNRGKAQILIDGTAVATVDLYAATLRQRQLVFVRDVPQGTHTITVKVLGTKNAASTGVRVDVDGIGIIRPPT